MYFTKVLLIQTVLNVFWWTSFGGNRNGRCQNKSKQTNAIEDKTSWKICKICLFFMEMRNNLSPITKKKYKKCWIIIKVKLTENVHLQSVWRSQAHWHRFRQNKMSRDLLAILFLLFRNMSFSDFVDLYYEVSILNCFWRKPLRWNFTVNETWKHRKKHVSSSYKIANSFLENG